MNHLGDITKINGSTVPPANVIIGGSPCQDLSVAGKRAGLAGERSGLFMEQIRIIKEMRKASERSGANDIKPRYMVWENVPGAFSSNKGQDFKAVLEETIGVVEKVKPDIPIPVGGWHYSGAIMGNGFSVAWRVFDAQFWGVSQRRRRIALVADFGGTTAPEILFECESVSGDFTQSGTPWQEFAAVVAKRFNSSNRGERIAVFDARGNGDGETVPTITGDHENRVTDYTTLCVRQRCSCEGGGKGCLVQSEKSGTLAANNDQFVCALDRASFNQGKNAQYNPEISESGINSTLTAKGASAVCAQSIVRRLTPLECERLQGFPDGWTDIPWKGKEHAPDGFRHRVCGNSMCVNVMRWVGERIAAVEAGKEFQDYGSVKDRGDNGESPPLAQEGGG